MNECFFQPLFKIFDEFIFHLHNNYRNKFFSKCLCVCVYFISLLYLNIGMDFQCFKFLDVIESMFQNKYWNSSEYLIVFPKALIILQAYAFLFVSSVNS